MSTVDPIITTNYESPSASFHYPTKFIFSPALLNSSFTISLTELVGIGDEVSDKMYLTANGFIYMYTVSFTVKNPNNETVATGSRTKEYISLIRDWDYSGQEEVSFNFSSLGTYTLIFEITRIARTVPTLTDFVRAVFYVAVSENRYPLKKWTITDVINRVFDTVIPLRQPSVPKFRLEGVNYNATTGEITSYDEGSVAEKLNKILAPEFAFTKMTLREMLQEVGGYIHAEPRIKVINTNGERYYVIGYDKYGGNQKSRIRSRKYVSASFSYDVNNYATGLDSSADNLVSQLDYAQGVVVEPFSGGGRSLRSEITTVRLTEDGNAFILTEDKLYQMSPTGLLGFNIRCTYIPTIGNGSWDISPYIFEKVQYDNLSSYQGTFPYCKAYALYYEQGKPNIGGLFFKSEHAVSSIFHNYAIINILEQVTGRSISLSDSQYMELAFEVSYLPIDSARIKTNKAIVLGGIPRNLAYNQSSNIIETRFYGENLKGVIARIGNVEKVYTYHLAYLSDVPKIGTLWDDNYYISTVSIELLPTYIKCTVALSKDFNRLSQFIGISSNKRMWEVSEKQAFDRETTLTDYLTIGLEPPVIDVKTNLLGNLLYENEGTVYVGAKKMLFTGTDKPISAVKVNCYTKSRQETTKNLTLPVHAFATGNSMLFSFRFKDNYSAGQKITKLDSSVMGEEGRGYWADFIPYCDYYGRFYFIRAEFLYGNLRYHTSSETPEEDEVFATPNTIPYGTIRPDQQIINEGEVNQETVYKRLLTNLIKYRKDSREVPKLNFEICTVALDSSIVIGSALLRESFLVNFTKFMGNSPTIKLYVFEERLNTIDGKLDGAIDTGLTINDFEFLVIPNLLTDYPNVKAWALGTVQTIEEIEVQDEDGNIVTQEIIKGGDLLLGQNDTPHGQRIYFGAKSDIYD